MSNTKLLGTLQLRQIAELVTGRDFNGAFNEDILEGAPEIKLLSLDDINKALGTNHKACRISAWGITPIEWNENGVLVPGNGLPSIEEQLEEINKHMTE